MVAVLRITVLLLIISLFTFSALMVFAIFVKLRNLQDRQQDILRAINNRPAESDDHDQQASESDARSMTNIRRDLARLDADLSAFDTIVVDRLRDLERRLLWFQQHVHRRLRETGIFLISHNEFSIEHINDPELRRQFQVLQIRHNTARASLTRLETRQRNFEERIRRRLSYLGDRLHTLQQVHFNVGVAERRIRYLEDQNRAPWETVREVNETLESTKCRCHERTTASKSQTTSRVSSRNTLWSEPLGERPDTPVGRHVQRLSSVFNRIRVSSPSTRSNTSPAPSLPANNSSRPSSLDSFQEGLLHGDLTTANLERHLERIRARHDPTAANQQRLDRAEAQIEAFRRGARSFPQDSSQGASIPTLRRDSTSSTLAPQPRRWDWGEEAFSDLDEAAGSRAEPRWPAVDILEVDTDSLGRRWDSITPPTPWSPLTDTLHTDSPRSLSSASSLAPELPPRPSRSEPQPHLRGGEGRPDDYELRRQSRALASQFSSPGRLHTRTHDHRQRPIRQPSGPPAAPPQPPPPATPEESTDWQEFHHSYCPPTCPIRHFTSTSSNHPNTPPDLAEARAQVPLLEEQLKEHNAFGRRLRAAMGKQIQGHTGPARMAYRLLISDRGRLEEANRMCDEAIRERRRERRHAMMPRYPGHEPYIPCGLDGIPELRGGAGSPTRQDDEYEEGDQDIGGNWTPQSAPTRPASEGSEDWSPQRDLQELLARRKLRRRLVEFRLMELDLLLFWEELDEIEGLAVHDTKSSSSSSSSSSNTTRSRESSPRPASSRSSHSSLASMSDLMLRFQELLAAVNMDFEHVTQEMEDADEDAHRLRNDMLATLDEIDDIRRRQREIDEELAYLDGLEERMRSSSVDADGVPDLGEEDWGYLYWLREEQQLPHESSDSGSVDDAAEVDNEDGLQNEQEDDAEDGTTSSFVFDDSFQLPRLRGGNARSSSSSSSTPRRFRQSNAPSPSSCSETLSSISSLELAPGEMLTELILLEELMRIQLWTTRLRLQLLYTRLNLAEMKGLSESMRLEQQLHNEGYEADSETSSCSSSTTPSPAPSNMNTPSSQPRLRGGSGRPPSNPRLPSPSHSPEPFSRSSHSSHYHDAPSQAREPPLTPYEIHRELHSRHWLLSLAQVPESMCREILTNALTQLSYETNPTCLRDIRRRIAAYSIDEENDLIRWLDTETASNIAGVRNIVSVRQNENEEWRWRSVPGHLRPSASLSTSPTHVRGTTSPLNRENYDNINFNAELPASSPTPSATPSANLSPSPNPSPAPEPAPEPASPVNEPAAYRCVQHSFFTLDATGDQCPMSQAWDFGPHRCEWALVAIPGAEVGTNSSSMDGLVGTGTSTGKAGAVSETGVLAESGSGSGNGNGDQAGGLEVHEVRVAIDEVAGVVGGEIPSSSQILLELELERGAVAEEEMSEFGSETGEADHWVWHVLHEWKLEGSR